jgi:hypothetical protein
MADRCWAKGEERRSAVNLVQDLEDRLLQLLWWSVLREQPPYSQMGLGA